MRLRRNSDDVASATADPTTLAPAPSPGSQPAANDISSIGVAIMPGMPLPDWVTTASIAAPAVASEAAAAPVQSFAAAGGYPRVDPAFEPALTARRAALVQTDWAETPTSAAPAYPAVDPAYEAVLAGVAAVPAPAADLPAPDPAQWSEHPVGTVVWGPVPTPAAPAPAVDLPVQAPVEAGVPAAAPVIATANALAFAPPPEGPAFFFDAPDDAADLEAPDLQDPTPPAAAPEPGPSTFDVTPDEPDQADGIAPIPAFAPETTADWPEFRETGVSEAPSEAPAAQPWFVTDLPDDQPPAPAGGAGQYGWLFQPDDTPQQDTGGESGSPTAWFDPGSTSTPEASAESNWGATATTVPVQWSEVPVADSTDDDGWMAAPEQPLAAVIAGSAAATADSELAAPVATVAPAAADPWAPPVSAPIAQPSISTTAPVGIVPVQQAPRTAGPAAPAPVASPVVPPAVADVQAPPPPPVASPPQSRPRRSKRWLVIAAIGALVAALALVALYVFPGFLKPAEPVSAPPTIVTPATAGDLTRTATVAAPVAAAFRRTAAALGATPSSKYATYASGQGVSATVWNSNGSSDSPAATQSAYESAGGVELGRLVSVPAGARGGAMACAAASATRSVCFWNADGVLGAADVRGLARTEAGALAARMRTALEQPSA